MVPLTKEDDLRVQVRIDNFTGVITECALEVSSEVIRQVLRFTTAVCVRGAADANCYVSPQPWAFASASDSNAAFKTVNTPAMSAPQGESCVWN